MQTAAVATAAVTEKVATPSAQTGKKLSFKEKRELEQLPALIETLDAELVALQVKVNAADFFRQSAEDTTAILNQLQQTESKLAHAYERWEQLEAINQQ